MDEPLDAPLAEPIRMTAYYYSFETTGVAIIDRILSAVATAGKAYHHTENWGDSSGDEVTQADRIQHVADEAAAAIAQAVSLTTSGEHRSEAGS